VATMPMAHSGQPQGQGAAQQAGGPPSSQPPQGQGQGQNQPTAETQATDLQRLLANWYQVAKQMASADPRLASGAEKVSQGIQEMQTALVTPPQPTPIGQQPQV